MLTARGTVSIRPGEVIPVYREEWNATVEDYKYDLVNRDFVSRNGNLYHAKVRRPGEFIPAGIAPDSVEGAKYWEMFNALKPTATNFLVITDEQGTPRTLMSGGRIQTEFLNIGSLNMSETRLWGGAEPMTGKGLALVNDPDDRKFVVYNDAANYVEMFMRSDEWGLKGVVDGSNVFRLGSLNQVGPFVISENALRADNPYSQYYSGGLELTKDKIEFSYAKGSIFSKRVYMGVAEDGLYNSKNVLEVSGGDIFHQGSVYEDGNRNCRFYTSALYLRDTANHRQIVNDEWAPVTYPLAAGEVYIGDINKDKALNCYFTNVRTTSYIVVGGFRTKEDGGDGNLNNNLSFCVTLRRKDYFKVSIGENTGDLNDAYFCWAIFKI